MCFAFRTITSTEDQKLEDILIMTNMKSVSNARALSVPVSSTTSHSASDDCVEVPPQKGARSAATQDRGSVQQATTVNSVGSKDRDEDEEDGGDKDQDTDDSTPAPDANRKRPGSSLVKGGAKKAKTAAVYQRPEPSGKGDDYDDLCWRANVKVRELKETIKQRDSELSDVQDQRDEAFVTVSHLKKQLKSQQAFEATKEAKHEADLKASVQEMKVTLRAEMEKKHKVANETKDRRHKEELARAKDRAEEAQEKMKEAKAEAKEFKPEHSSLLQQRDKKIKQLEDAKATLEGIADKLKSDKAKLGVDKEGLAKALAHQSDEILDIQGDMTRLRGELRKERATIARQNEDYDTMKTSLERKWQIQYDNAQHSAQVASEVQRSLHPTTCALNACIIKRDGLEIKLKDAEAEIAMLRDSISKSDGSDQVVKGE